MDAKEIETTENSDEPARKRIRPGTLSKNEKRQTKNSFVSMKEQRIDCI